MKKLTSLLILLLSNVLIFCQSTNTNPINQKCFTEEQITEIFKGLQQGEFLKVRLSKADAAIEDADNLIKSQKNTISKMELESAAKERLIATNEALYNQEKKIFEIKNAALKSELDFTKTQLKKEKNKAFWNGIKIGGISVAVLGAVAIIAINQ